LAAFFCPEKWYPIKIKIYKGEGWLQEIFERGSFIASPEK